MSRGYKFITLNGKLVSEHRHIMEKFTGKKIPDGMVVNHKNGIKSDNRIENLEIISQSENLLHAWKIGLNYSAFHDDNRKPRTCVKCEHAWRSRTPNPKTCPRCGVKLSLTKTFDNA